MLTTTETPRDPCEHCLHGGRIDCPPEKIMEARMERHCHSSVDPDLVEDTIVLLYQKNPNIPAFRLKRVIKTAYSHAWFFNTNDIRLYYRPLCNLYEKMYGEKLEHHIPVRKS